MVLCCISQCSFLRLSSLFLRSRPQLRNKSSKAWLRRSKKDNFSRDAKASNFPSRAVYKLAQLNAEFKLFKPGMTVVDLGWAPGSWSKYAAQKTRPNGRVVGVDLLCLPPPEGVTTLQGNFLSQTVQAQLEGILANENDGRSLPSPEMLQLMDKPFDEERELQEQEEMEVKLSEGNLERERELQQAEASKRTRQSTPEDEQKIKQRKPSVDVVLSDMCGSTGRSTGFWLNSVNSPFIRLQNTSGILVRDHAASMDICDAALVFALRNLKPGGSFLCKFYAGEEDHLLEKRLKQAFRKVHRVKPTASRKESREAYFLASKFRKEPVGVIFKHMPKELKLQPVQEQKVSSSESNDQEQQPAQTMIGM